MNSYGILISHYLGYTLLEHEYIAYSKYLFGVFILFQSKGINAESWVLVKPQLSTHLMY